MRILSIHIDDFGKISNFDMDFLTNPVIISEENGWGKSTLASFVKVMFYGFGGENKKKLTERERVRFKPWNKGNYGGRIIFESKGREYELTKHFGDKDKDDTASILDVSTMLPSNDFSIQNLGEELFGIDEESFVRTVFVGQGNIDVFGEKESIGDGIAARIGNLTDATDDLNNYEKIHEMLVAKGRELKSGNTKGIINELTAKSTELKVNISRGTNIRESVCEIETKLKENELKKSRLKQELDKLDKELILAGKKDVIRMWTDENNALLKDKSDIEDRIGECKDVISGDMPEIEEIELKKEQAGKLQGLRLLIKQHQGGKTTGEVCVTDIDERDVKYQMDNYSNLEESKKKLEALDYRIITEEDRAEFIKEQQAQECKRRNKQLQEDYEEKVELAKSKAKLRAIMIAMLGIILLLSAVAGFIFLPGIAGVILLIAGMSVLVTGIINMNTGVKKAAMHIKEPEFAAMPVAGKSEKLEAMISERENLLKEINIITNQIKDFLEKNHIECSEQEIFQKLYELKDVTSRKETNEQLIKEYEEKCKEAELLESQINMWLENTKMRRGEDYVQDINRVSMVANEYYHLLERLKEINIKLEQKEKQKPLEVNVDYSQVRDFDEITDLKEKLESDKTRNDSIIETYVKQLEELRETLEIIEEDEEYLKVISDKLDESRHKYDIITQTVKYMETAKERLTSRYMNPIADAFKKYYGYISKGDLDDYNIDANINITKNEFGERRNTASLSRGYRDLIDVALRMALVDAMYEDEKPFVVLDDPFVNLDTEKMNRAKDFLEKLSSDYQVIYFTCHDSRAL